MSWLVAYVLRGVTTLLLFGLVVIPLSLLVTRLIPEGRIKRLLTKRRGFGASADQ